MPSKKIVPPIPALVLLRQFTKTSSILRTSPSVRDSEASVSSKWLIIFSCHSNISSTTSTLFMRDNSHTITVSSKGRYSSSLLLCFEASPQCYRLQLFCPLQSDVLVQALIISNAIHLGPVTLRLVTLWGQSSISQVTLGSDGNLWLFRSLVCLYCCLLYCKKNLYFLIIANIEGEGKR